MVKDIINNAADKIQKSIKVLNEDLGTLRAGMANPQILDRVSVEYYGAETPINQLANISVPEPRVLLIQPWDKTSVGAIEKAILISDLGLNPSNDGSVIRLIIPELTEETRKALVKKVKKLGEETKVAIRSIRRDSNDKIKKLKKDSVITEDDEKNAEKEIQKITDSFIKDIDGIIKNKENDILTV